MHKAALLFLTVFLAAGFGQHGRLDQSDENLKRGKLDSESKLVIGLYGTALAGDAAKAGIAGTMGTGFDPLPATALAKWRSRRIDGDLAGLTLFNKQVLFGSYFDPMGGIGSRMEILFDRNTKFILAGSNKSFFYGLRWLPHFRKK